MSHVPENRRFPREPISAPIWLIQDENQVVLRAQTDNLSYGGAHLLVEGPSMLDVGQDVRVRMVLPDTFDDADSFCSVDAPATVAWVGPFAESEHGQTHLGLSFKTPVPVPLLTAVS